MAGEAAISERTPELIILFSENIPDGFLCQNILWLIIVSARKIKTN